MASVWKSVNILNLFSEIRVLEDNNILESILQNIAMPSVTHDALKISGFGEVTAEELFLFWFYSDIDTEPKPSSSVDLSYQMTLPPNFDKAKKYPLLIDV